LLEFIRCPAPQYTISHILFETYIECLSPKREQTASNGGAATFCESDSAAFAAFAAIAFALALDIGVATSSS
jgi:hypothetical protein